MKLDINQIKGYLVKSKPKSAQNIGESVKMMPEFLQELIEKLTRTATDEDSILLFDHLMTENKDLSRLDIVLHKFQDYSILNMHKFHGNPYAQSIKMLNKNNINIAPNLIKVIDKGDSVYLVFHTPGTKTSELIPFSKGYPLLSDEAKKSAFKDLQKLTKAGFVNQQMLRGSSAWYVTPDTNQVMIADWTQLRPINKGERKGILDTCYKTLFNK